MHTICGRTHIAIYYYSCSFLPLCTCLYHFGKREISINQSTKRIILLSPRQISKKFFNYCVNAFTAKKIHVITMAICSRETLTLPSGKKLSKKITSRCDSSKSIDARKLYKKLNLVIMAFHKKTAMRC